MLLRDLLSVSPILGLRAGLDLDELRPGGRELFLRLVTQREREQGPAGRTEPLAFCQLGARLSGLASTQQAPPLFEQPLCRRGGGLGEDISTAKQHASRRN